VSASTASGDWEVDVNLIPGIMTLNPPASSEAILKVGEVLPAELPEEYATLLSHADGITAERFILYSCEELPERNSTFEVGLYAPGFVAIGDDNGGTAIVMRGGRGHSPVYLVGRGTMQPDDMVHVAICLSDWMKAGCPTDV